MKGKASCPLQPPTSRACSSSVLYGSAATRGQFGRYRSSGGGPPPPAAMLAGAAAAAAAGSRACGGGDPRALTGVGMEACPGAGVEGRGADGGQGWGVACGCGGAARAKRPTNNTAVCVYIYARLTRSIVRWADSPARCRRLAATQSAAPRRRRRLVAGRRSGLLRRRGTGRREGTASCPARRKTCAPGGHPRVQGGWGWGRLAVLGGGAGRVIRMIQCGCIHVGSVGA